MDYMTRYEGTKRIELDDGFWVDVKVMLTGSQKRAVRAKQITYGVEKVKNRRGDETTRQVIEKIDSDTFLYEMAIASIVAWNLPEGDGTDPWPLEPESVKRAHYDLLTEKDQDTIETECAALNAEPTKEEDASFPAGGEGSVPAEDDEASDDREILPRAEVLESAGDPR